MRCKACDRPVEGEKELCSGCGRVSSLVASMEPHRAPESMSDNMYFGIMVKRHDLGTSWREGLGLMTPEGRYQHMHDRALERFRDNRKWGMSQYMAFAKATGLANRGNQRFTNAGLTTGKFASSQGGGTPTGVDPKAWGPQVSYEFL